MEEKQYIKYLQQKGLAKSTQKCYLDNTKLFLKWLGTCAEYNRSKEDIQCEKKDILNYLDYLKNKRHQKNITRRNQIIAIKHYFDFLQTGNLIETNPTALIKIRGVNRKQLTRIYTSEELDQIYDNYYHVYIRDFDNSHIPKNQQKQSFLCRNRNFVMLGVLIYQGIITTELNKLDLDDIDLIKGTIKLKSSKRATERTLILKAPQIGSLMNYITTIRPQFLTYTTESEKLFLPLPPSGNSKTESQDITTIKTLSNQIKTLDKNFIDFRQVRTSVITNWIKTDGLRKAQHLAGHRHIHSTEAYLPNDLEALINDISTHHPFNL